MWFFVDESWGPETFRPRFGVLFGVLCRDEDIPKLESFLYGIKRKYRGQDYAKTLNYELKGKKLFSNYILHRQSLAGSNLLDNLCIAKEMLTFPETADDIYLRAFSSIVYSASDEKPALLCPDPKDLADPFRLLVQNVSIAAREFDRKRRVTLVFDQRVGAQTEIAIAIRNFIGGMTSVSNVGRTPLMGVSNVCPGLQFADVFAYLTAKRVQKDKRINAYYRDLFKLQWVQKPRKGRGQNFGFNRLDDKKRRHFDL